jgi:hypothetical protein
LDRCFFVTPGSSSRLRFASNSRGLSKNIGAALRDLAGRGLVDSLGHLDARLRS